MAILLSIHFVLKEALVQVWYTFAICTVHTSTVFDFILPFERFLLFIDKRSTRACRQQRDWLYIPNGFVWMGCYEFPARNNIHVESDQWGYICWPPWWTYSVIIQYYYHPNQSFVSFLTLLSWNEIHLTINDVYCVPRHRQNVLGQPINNYMSFDVYQNGHRAGSRGFVSSQLLPSPSPQCLSFWVYMASAVPSQPRLGALEVNVTINLFSIWPSCHHR